MGRYWKILRKYKIYLFLSPFLVGVAVLCETVQPRFMAEIVDNGIVLCDLSVVMRIGGYMILVSLLGLLASVANIYLSSVTSTAFGTDLRRELFSRIQRLSLKEIDRFGTASLITRLTNDTGKIQQVVLTSMRILLRSPLMLAMAVFWIFRIHTGLALIVVGIIPLLVVGAYFVFRKGYPFFLKVQREIDRLNGVVRENLVNIRVVKSFVRERHETGKFARSAEELRDTVIRASNIIVSVFPLMQLVMNLSILLLLWFGGGMVISGELKVGELISFVNYLSQVLISLMMMSMIIMTIARASTSSVRVLEVLDIPHDISAAPSLWMKQYRITEGQVSFRNVSFHYERGENDVLKGITFDVARGETIAIVGATGSAKTSMVQLIPRLYEATGGQVLIDGINIKQYRPRELRNHIAIVFQESELFSGTVLDNLKWGNPYATVQEVEQAAQTAQAHDFILALPKGYDTPLGRGGVNLSGGQRQRLSIARALLRRPKILIMDDCTSAVDPDTEQKIRQNLKTSLKGTTLFVVTQRANTMQAADRIIVLENGEINAIGAPEDLLLHSRAYQEILHSQQMAIEGQERE